MRVLACKATKYKFAQDTLKYFEMFVIIYIVGYNIDPSCKFFYKINVCLTYVHCSGVEVCFVCIYK